MTSMRQVRRALPRPNPIKCAFWVCWPIFPALLNFLGLSNASMREMRLLLAADLLQKCINPKP